MQTKRTVGNLKALLALIDVFDQTAIELEKFLTDLGFLGPNELLEWPNELQEAVEAALKEVEQENVN